MSKSKTLFLLALGLSLGLAAAAPVLAQSFELRRDIVVGAGESQDTVFILGGTATVDGRVKKSVVAIGGTVVISGTVGDSVVGIGSSITLKSTAVVKKDVVAIGGSLDREPGASVGNDTVYFDLGKIVPGFMKGHGARGFFSLSIVPIILILKLITVFIWLLLTILVAAIFPKQVALASDQVRKSFWPAFGIGFLGFIVFTGLIIISAILCLILIGIPILLFVGIAAMALRVFGQVAVFHFFGESLWRSISRREPSALGASLVGLVVVSFIGFVPVLGLLFSFVVSILAFGVAIMTKFGTTTNWLGKKSAPAAPAGTE
jgi:hypothetical protein